MTTPRSLLLAALCICTPTAVTHAQPRDPRVDSVFAAYDTPNSPGCALGVYRDGQIVYARGYGLADLERRVPITPATVFDLGSTS